MSTHIFVINLKKIPKICLNVCFLQLSKEYPRDLKTSLNQPWLNEPSVLE